jgi:hypothetical protein
MLEIFEVYEFILRNGCAVAVQIFEAEKLFGYRAYGHKMPLVYGRDFDNKDEAIAAAVRHIEQQDQSDVVQRYMFDNPVRISPVFLDLETLRKLLRRIVDRDLVWRDGDCIFCHEWLGGVVEQWQVDLDGYPAERLGDYCGKHKPDCPGIEARKLLGLPVREGMDVA